MRKKITGFILAAVALLSGCVIDGNAGNVEGSEISVSEHFASYSSSDPSENGGDGTHVDTDNNGFCDDCGASVTVTFDFFALNDLHGKFADTDSQPGVDELSTYLKNAKTENENTVLLSSGDMWQGSAESNLTKGKLLTEWMNEMDFVSMTLGNHEYDWGETYLEENRALAEFPFLAINVFNRATNERVEYCAPSVTIEKSGVKIGVIGAIGDCYSSISADKVGDVFFKTDRELTALVKAESQRLRDEGADLIVYSLHDGYGSSRSSITNVSDGELTYYDIGLSEGYVDLVFEGHTHQRYVLRDSKGVYHLQNGGDNDGISHAEVTVNYVNDTSVVNKAEFISTDEYTSLDGDPVVETLLGKYEEQISLAGKVLGYNGKYRTGNELRQLIADLYYKTGMERWGETYDLVLGGGFISVRSPYDLAAGEVVYGDLQSLFPFDNELVLCSVSGSNLKRKFFETTNANYFISYGDHGAAVKNNIELDKTYYIVTDSYTSTYAPNGLTEIERYDTTTFARDLLAAYVQAGGLTESKENINFTSIPDILAIGKVLADNGQTKEEYFVKGKIVQLNNGTWGNLTIEDEEGNRLYIFGLYDETGSVRYDAMGEKPALGDTIVLKGPIKKYVAVSGAVTVEIMNGRLFSVESA